MKITIEIDCSPEEARRAIGLPDVAAAQERWLAQVTEGGFKPDQLEAMIKGWAPLGEAGLGLWRALGEAARREPPR